MFGPLGFQELLLLFIVALIIFGPKRLPQIGKSLGKGLAEFKRATNELKHAIEEEAGSSGADGPRESHEIRPSNEIRPLQPPNGTAEAPREASRPAPIEPE